MSFNWRRDGKRDRWIYDHTWAVEYCGNQWYVVKDGRMMLEEYPELQAAMEAAERRIAEAAK